MKPVTYALQFRGLAASVEGGLRKEASAPGGGLMTSLTCEGVEGHFVSAPQPAEAFFRSVLRYTGDGAFEEEGAIVFARGHVLRIRGHGELAASPDPHLHQGTVVWDVGDGEGQFANARGRITSNFFLSNTGELTDNQLGAIFVNGCGAA